MRIPFDIPGLCFCAKWILPFNPTIGESILRIYLGALPDGLIARFTNATTPGEEEK